MYFSPPFLSVICFPPLLSSFLFNSSTCPFPHLVSSVLLSFLYCSHLFLSSFLPSPPPLSFIIIHSFITLHPPLFLFSSIAPSVLSSLLSFPNPSRFPFVFDFHPHLLSCSFLFFVLLVIPHIPLISLSQCEGRRRSCSVTAG